MISHAPAHVAGGDDDDGLPSLDVARHTAFFLRHLRMLPQPYQSQDTQRMTLAYFALSSLDLLGVLDEKVAEEEGTEFRDWIYAQQLNEQQGGGFLPSGHSPSNPASSSQALGVHALAASHPSLAMSYTALLNLAILGDDFGRLDVGALRAHLRGCQNQEGSFSPNPSSPEADLRFVYCAFVICSLLGAWDAVDVGKALAFVASCRNYDGGYAQRPGLESHGGSTYCALASIHLWRASRGKRDAAAGATPDPLHSDEELESTRRWLAMRQVGLEDVGREEEIEILRRKRRQGAEAAKLQEDGDEDDEDDEPYSQVGGLNGRTGKKADVCYSFWCGAGARLLPSSESAALCSPLHSTSSEMAWLLSSQHPRFGGISKTPDVVPDVMHAYLALAALAMDVWEDQSRQEALPSEELKGAGRENRIEEWRVGLKEQIGRLDPALNLRVESAERLVEQIGARVRREGGQANA